MSDIPFGATIRAFMYKINEEKTRISGLLNNRPITMTDEEFKWLIDWDMQLSKLSSLCSTVSDFEIKVRRNTNQKI